MMLSGPDSSMLRVLVLLLLPARSSCAVEEHRISSPPGYGAPSVPMYSGTVATPHPTVAGVTVHSHYVLVTADADPGAGPPPTLAWFQGGPGSSAMLGLFTENGPLTLNDFSTKTAEFNRTGIPTVFDNPFLGTRSPTSSTSSTRADRVLVLLGAAEQHF